MSTPARSLRLLVLVPALLLLATGYTSCEYFTQVTVPASDSGAPITYDGVWVNGDYVVGAVNGTTFAPYHIAPGQTVLAVASAIDTGGTRRLKMSSSFRWTCCKGSICTLTQPVTVPQIEEQAGGVGSTVSNGIWLYSSVTLPTCPGGYTLRDYRFGWSTEAEDFHGNRTSGLTQSIVYP